MLQMNPFSKCGHSCKTSSASGGGTSAVKRYKLFSFNPCLQVPVRTSLKKTHTHTRTHARTHAHTHTLIINRFLGLFLILATMSIFSHYQREHTACIYTPKHQNTHMLIQS
ncbi:hypothetical protein AMECASPLE_021278 [Ameca splendens]|uniref:Uncharacterized protein n=1 Tax=Ameca splendens TaxID=208324 RepID=A0ABV0ZCU3_9TELE